MKGEVIPIIIGMGIVTYLPRWLPLFFLTRYRLSPWLIGLAGFHPGGYPQRPYSAVHCHDR